MRAMAADMKELKVIEIPLDDQRGAESITGETELDLKQFDLKHGSELSYAVRVVDTERDDVRQPRRRILRPGGSSPRQRNRSPKI